MSDEKIILVTGATGKVEQAVIRRLLSEERFNLFLICALFDDAWAYQRSENDPRKIWYPG